MKYLLDVNVLIALVDSRHTNHEAAHAWFTKVRDWATCPLTENAFVRILSNPSYPTVMAQPGHVTVHLKRFVKRPHHHFFPDSVSLRSASLFDPTLIEGTKQVTDVYLLGLAHKNGAKLATFDRKLSARAVRGTSAKSIELIDP